jgi:alkanesulfonate monooxygenase SsuD/methylene tetrahydromethanopterin reductase-like flavin-dependent oxidoreductase (luciferase family)
MPERAILPKPYQKPHPPMWVAVSSSGTELDAAERGMGSLGISFAPMSVQDQVLKRYRKTIQNCNPVGAFVNDRVATINFLYCHEDDKIAQQVGGGITSMFQPLAVQFMHNPEALPSKPGAHGGLLSQLRAQLAGNPREGMAIGDPKHIITELKKWEGMGVDIINFMLNCVEVVPHEKVIESLRLFSKEVMPYFKNESAKAAAE